MNHHPIVELFPLMTAEEYDALKASIAANGLQEPCRTWRGLLIDGRHRYRACSELGIEPRVAEWEGEEDEMARFVFGLNLHRRHLTSSQKASVMADFEGLLASLEAAARERQREGGKTAGRGRPAEQVVEFVPQPIGKSRDQAAAIAGTNPRYISDAKKLKAEAPELHAKVKQGDLTINQAKAALARRKREAAKRLTQAEAAPPASGDLWSVHQGESPGWLLSLPGDSVNLVFGSPPYEDARLYLEDGENVGVTRKTEAWVAWMVEAYQAALRCCTGLVAFVVEGRTSRYRWSASPALLMAELHRSGIHLRKPPVYQRVGIPGSGGPDWLRNDYEFIVCATRGGELPWSDNTAMGKPPVYEPGGDPSHRKQDGSRVNAESGPASHKDRKNEGAHRARYRAGSAYEPPAIANPGNVIACKAGGGNMGDGLCHENEAPFPEALAEFFVRSFCPPGGVVCDPFSGSGTTGAVAVRHGRRFLGCDLRPSQVELSRRRIARVQPLLPNIGA